MIVKIKYLAVAQLVEQSCMSQKIGGSPTFTLQYTKVSEYTDTL